MIFVLNYASHPGMCPIVQIKASSLVVPVSGKGVPGLCTHESTHVHTHIYTHHSPQACSLPYFVQCVHLGAIPTHSPEARRRQELCFHKQHLFRLIFILELL